MAVATVSIWRPNPGRFQDFLGAVTQARKIHERLGGKVRVEPTLNEPPPDDLARTDRGKATGTGHGAKKLRSVHSRDRIEDLDDEA